MAHVVGDLHQIGRQRTDRAVRTRRRSQAPSAHEICFRHAATGSPVNFRISSAAASSKPFGAFNPVPTAVAPKAMRPTFGTRRFDQRPCVFQHPAPAGNFLTKTNRHGVLQMRPPRLDDVRVVAFDARQRQDHPVDRREKAAVQRAQRRDVQRGRERVV